MSDLKTKEPQYQAHVELDETSLGIRANAQWQGDPKMLGISLARYKFVAKMFTGKQRVLEVGCGDGFNSRLIAQEVGELVAVDFDPLFVENALANQNESWPVDCRVHDMLTGPVDGGTFDAAYALDVLEHIDKADERVFMDNVAASLKDDGALIIGMPSLESQQYASPLSKEGHVNCKAHMEIRELMESYFHNVFLFSMNDEVVHTGFLKMAHYVLALCANKRS